MQFENVPLSNFWANFQHKLYHCLLNFPRYCWKPSSKNHLYYRLIHALSHRREKVDFTIFLLRLQYVVIWRELEWTEKLCYLQVFKFDCGPCKKKVLFMSKKGLWDFPFTWNSISRWQLQIIKSWKSWRNGYFFRKTFLLWVILWKCGPLNNAYVVDFRYSVKSCWFCINI